MDKEHALTRAISIQKQYYEGCPKESAVNKASLADDANVVTEDVNYKEYVTAPSKYLGPNKINGKKVEEFLVNPEFL